MVSLVAAWCIIEFSLPEILLRYFMCVGEFGIARGAGAHLAVKPRAMCNRLSALSLQVLTAAQQPTTTRTPASERAQSRASVRARGSAQHAFSILIRAVTSTFRALRGTAINGDPGSKLADYIPITESQAASVLGVGADATQMHDFDHTVLFADIDVGKVLGVGWR